MIVFLGEGARRRGGAQCRNEHYATPQSPLYTPRRLLSDLFRNGKLDADVLAAALTSELTYDGSGNKIGYAGIVDAIGVLDEEENTDNEENTATTEGGDSDADI